MFNYNYIGIEYIFLGLIYEGEGVVVKLLELLGILLEGVCSQVEEIIGQGQQVLFGYILFIFCVKKVFELSLCEVLQFGYNYIGIEYILLGFI